DIAEILSTKHRFRELQRKHGLPHPRFIAVNSLQALMRGLRDLEFPIVFKPVDSSGSRGVRMVGDGAAAAIRAAFDYAKCFSRAGLVCVEQFVGGPEVGGDCFLQSGRIVFAAITHKHLDGFVVTGHSLPTNISEENQRRVCAVLEETCAAAGYRDVLLNFDVKVTPQDAVALEISARNGGNGIPAIIERATGVDIEEPDIRIALGQQPFPSASGSTSKGSLVRGAGSLVFGSAIEGTLARVSTFSEA